MSAKRILLFCHDGTGLGHLRRISRIAGTLCQRHACLIISGAREAHWMVPQCVEFVKLPAWASIDRLHARRCGREPSIDMSREEALAFRRNMLIAVVDSFKPDAIIVDYLPFGKSGELCDVLARTQARKYLVHRGITDSSDEAILKGAATAEIAACYDRIIVMADPTVSNLAIADNYCPEAAAKLTYCGYAMADKPEKTDSATYDVVCAGGGGAGSEELMLSCIRAARANPNLDFCIVPGPRSQFVIGSDLNVPGNATVIGSTEQLPELLVSASIIVCSGGYNSILEAVAGGGRILVHPSQRGTDDEQKMFSAQLSRFYPIRLVDNLDALPERIQEEMTSFLRHGRAEFPLRAEGFAQFVRIVSEDLEPATT